MGQCGTCITALAVYGEIVKRSSNVSQRSVYATVFQTKSLFVFIININDKRITRALEDIFLVSDLKP